MIAASGIVLGFLLATAYGAGFHLLLGGPARRIILYLFASWLGFALGHFVGDFFSIELFKLGPIHLFGASLGSWIALIASWWLGRDAPAPARRPAGRSVAPVARSEKPEKRGPAA
jgi:hypothetical protein